MRNAVQPGCNDTTKTVARNAKFAPEQVAHVRNRQQQPLAYRVLCEGKDPREERGLTIGLPRVN